MAGQKEKEKEESSNSDTSYLETNSSERERRKRKADDLKITAYAKHQVKHARNLGFELGDESIFQGYADLDKALEMAPKYLTGEVREKFIREFKEKHSKTKTEVKTVKKEEDKVSIGSFIKKTVKQKTIKEIEVSSYYTTSEEEESEESDVVDKRIRYKVSSLFEIIKNI